MGHATTIRDNLLELEQAAQRLTPRPQDAPPPAPPIVEGDNERALRLHAPLTNLLLESQRRAADKVRTTKHAPATMVAGIAMPESRTD